MNSELQFRFARPPAQYEEVRLARSACILKRILFVPMRHNLPGISNSVRPEALDPAFVQDLLLTDYMVRPFHPHIVSLSNLKNTCISTTALTSERATD